MVDSLVFHLQLIHDGDIPRWSCEHDSDEDSSQRLRTVQQRRRHRWDGDLLIAQTLLCQIS